MPHLTVCRVLSLRMCVCVCVCMCVQELASGSRIGFDPSLTSFSEFITSVMLGVSLSLSLSLSIPLSLSLSLSQRCTRSMLRQLSAVVRFWYQY